MRAKNGAMVATTRSISRDRILRGVIARPKGCARRRHVGLYPIKPLQRLRRANNVVSRCGRIGTACSRRPAPGSSSIPLAVPEVFGLRVPDFARQIADFDTDLAQGTEIFALYIGAENQIRVGRTVQPAVRLDFGF